MAIRGKWLRVIVLFNFIFSFALLSEASVPADGAEDQTTVEFTDEAQPSENPINTDDPQLHESDTTSDKLQDKSNSIDSRLIDSRKAADDVIASEMSTMSMSMSTSWSSDNEGAGVTVIAVENSVFTGAAAYKVPIEVPPGRNSMTPEISLVYNSYLGNGWVGVGWTLDMGAIQRSTKFGLDYTADNYVFTSSGSKDDLVARSEWGTGYYGNKIEETFSKYYFNNTTGGWEVSTKDGTRYFYGTTADSRQDDPADTDRVFKWCLDRVEDTNGNFMRISYFKDTTNGQIYLDRIDYTGNGSLAPSNYVKFYIEDRPDTSISYTSKQQIPVRFLHWLRVLFVFLNPNNSGIQNQCTAIGSESRFAIDGLF